MIPLYESALALAGTPILAFWLTACQVKSRNRSGKCMAKWKQFIDPLSLKKILLTTVSKIRDNQITAQLCIQTFDKMRSKGWSFLLFVLMNKKMNFLNSLILPLLQPHHPLIQAAVVG